MQEQRLTYDHRSHNLIEIFVCEESFSLHFFAHVLHQEPAKMIDSPSTLAPIDEIESLDFCAILGSESNVVPFKLVCM
jgi:hypothetical protein